MGILTKAAPTLSEDNFIDIMPVAWELMLESDQELAAAAGEYLHKIWFQLYNSFLASSDLSSADKLYKQFGPRSDRQNIGLDLAPNCSTL